MDNTGDSFTEYGEKKMKMEIRGLEKLSFRERQVVILKETGHSYEEIAKKLSISTSTVATLYNRARNKGYEIVAIISGTVLGLTGDDEE